MNHLTYDGFCFNDMHKKWLDGLMDRSMLRVLTNSEVPSHDKGFSEEITKYFSVSIEDADVFMSSATADTTKKAHDGSSSNSESMED